jgi:ketosteroid isomerase-like protein
MRSQAVALALVLGLGAGTARAQDPIAETSHVVAGFVDAVNKGQMDKAIGYFAASATVVDDLAPYRWSGPGAGAAWIAAMGANAGAKGMAAIQMKADDPSRIEVAQDHAYLVAPGLLTLTYTDGRTEHAKGQLAFTLTHGAGGWKIDTLTWTGPAPER